MDPSCRTWRTARALLLIYGSPPRKFLECYDIGCWVTLPNLWAQNSWLHRMLDQLHLMFPISGFRAPLMDCMPCLSFGTTTCLARTSDSLIAVFQTKYPLPVPVFSVPVMMMEMGKTDNWGAADKSGVRLILNCCRIVDSDGSETLLTPLDTKSICRFASEVCEKDGEVPQ